MPRSHRPKGTLAWANARFSVRSRSHRANHPAARPLHHTGFGSRGLLSGSINWWVLARGSTAKTIYCQDDLPPRDVGIVHVSADRRNFRARRWSTSGPVAGISSCADRVHAGVSSSTTPMCGDRRTAAETRGPSRLPLCDAGVRRVEPTATPSRNDDIQTPITEEAATLQLDEGPRSPSSASSPGEVSPPPALRQPD
jgi:hypothetical protein